MAFQPTFNPKTGLAKTLVRLSYFRGFEKTASVKGGKLKYRTNGLMSKETKEGRASIKVSKEAVYDLIKKEWPGKDPEKFLKSLKDRSPLFDGDEYVNDDGDVREHYDGQMFLKLTNDKKPKYKDRRGEDVDEEDREDMFVSGYWAIAYWHLYAIKDKDKGGNGIFTTIDALQYYKRDEEFTGGGIDDDEIADLGDEDDDDFDDDDKPAKSKKAKGRSIDDEDDDDLGL